MLDTPPAPEKPVLVPVDRVVFVSRPVDKVQRWRWPLCPLFAKMYACDHRPGFVQPYPQLWCYCPSPPFPCLTDAFEASKAFSDQAPPLSSELLHTRPSGHFTSNFRLLFRQTTEQLVRSMMGWFKGLTDKRTESWAEHSADGRLVGGLSHQNSFINSLNNMYNVINTSMSFWLLVNDEVR